MMGTQKDSIMGVKKQRLLISEKMFVESSACKFAFEGKENPGRLRLALVGSLPHPRHGSRTEGGACSRHRCAGFSQCCLLVDIDDYSRRKRRYRTRNRATLSPLVRSLCIQPDDTRVMSFRAGCQGLSALPDERRDFAAALRRVQFDESPERARRPHQ